MRILSEEQLSRMMVDAQCVADAARTALDQAQRSTSCHWTGGSAKGAGSGCEEPFSDATMRAVEELRKCADAATNASHMFAMLLARGDV